MFASPHLAQRGRHWRARLAHTAARRMCAWFLWFLLELEGAPEEIKSQMWDGESGFVKREADRCVLRLGCLT